MGYNYYDYDKDPDPVIVKNDELGEDRFKKLEATLSLYKLTPEHTRAFERIKTVFTFRLGIAKQALFPRQFPEAARRLEKLNKPKFFLDALEKLIEDVKKAAAAKAAVPKKPRQYNSWYR